MIDSPLSLQQALTAHRAGDLPAATRGYQAWLHRHPRDPVAMHHLGLALCMQGDPDHGLPLLLDSCAAQAATADFFLNTANVLAERQQIPAALNLLQQGLERHPSQPDLVIRQGELLLTTGQAATGRQLLAQLDPSQCAPTLAYQLATLLYRCAEFSAAEAALQRVLVVNPDFLPGLNLQAALLRARGQSEAALQIIDQALLRCADDAESLRNRATLLRDLHRLPEALAASEAALNADRYAPTAWNTCGSILLDLRLPNDAEFCFRQALTVDQDNANAHFNLGLTRLTLGDWRTGFAEYEWRTRLADVAGIYPDFGLPRWQGQLAPDAELLLVAEQGHGDTLQFIRLAYRLKERVGRVAARVQPALVKLLRNLPWLDEVSALGATSPVTADYVLPLLSLPAILGIDESSLKQWSAPIPYLQPTTVDREFWQKRLPPPAGLRIGLAWAGDPRPQDPAAHRIDARRSLPLTLLRPLISAFPEHQFFSLQKGEAAQQCTSEDQIHDWSSDFTDFARTAALIAELDLVISVDTAVAHLAGALGKPVWLLSRFDACWRWLDGRDDSPWYPALRLFRQSRSGDWTSVISAVEHALQRPLPVAHD